MDNAHERRWPPGLLTLETRQMNRRQYEQVRVKLVRFLLELSMFIKLYFLI